MGREGRLFILEKEDAPGSDTYTVVGGLRSTGVTINNEMIDITNKGSNRWREILDNAGLRSISFSGGGVFNNDAVKNDAIDLAISGALTNWRVSDNQTGGQRFTGAFKLTSDELTGDDGDADQFSMTLESSGVVTNDTVP